MITNVFYYYFVLFCFVGIFVCLIKEKNHVSVIHKKTLL